MNLRRLLLLLSFFLLAACERGADETQKSSVPSNAIPRANTDALARGAQLYAKNCAECHGPQAQGHPDWQLPSDGTFVAAPPLNGTGNDKNRTQQELIASIKDGKRRNGALVMPAWQTRLSDQDVTDIVLWFQSLWPPETYEAWYKRQALAAPAKS